MATKAKPAADKGPPAKKKKEKLDVTDPAAMMAAMVGTVGSDELAYAPGTDIGLDFLTPKYLIRTGITVLDAILGGGMGTGRMSEVYGPNKTAKSELVLRIGEAFLLDHPDGIFFNLDQEQAMDSRKLESTPAYRDNEGRYTIMTQPTLERAMGKIITMLTAVKEAGVKRPILIAVDSLKALQTAEEAGAKLEDLQIAAQARVLSRAMPKLNPIISKTNAHLLFTNQIRKSPGQMAFMDDESPGGEAVKFWTSYRIRTKPKGAFTISKGKGTVKDTPPDGIVVSMKTVKHKLGVPDRTIEIPLIYNTHGGVRSGLSDVWSLFYTLKSHGQIKVRGSRYYLKGLDEGFERDWWYAIMRDQGFGPDTGYRERMEAKTALGEALRTWASWVLDPASHGQPAGEVDGDASALMDDLAEYGV